MLRVDIRDSANTLSLKLKVDLRAMTQRIPLPSWRVAMTE